MKQSWKRVKTQTLLEHSRLTIVEDDVVLPDGHQTKYLRFEGVRDYVTVIATDGDKLALLTEYAYPSDQWLWQLPEGTIDEGETAEQAGQRELLEEAGLIAEDMRKIGTSLGYHRRSEQRCHLMLASKVRQGVKAPGDAEEQGTELHWLPIDEVRRMMADGRIMQQSALSALGIYFSMAETKTSSQQ
jgi:ADP-ribose pyrophosphatase